MFKLALRGLNTFVEQNEILAGVNLLLCTIRSSEAQIRSLQCQLSFQPVALESVQSEVGRLQTSLEEVNCKLSAFQADFISIKSVRDESRAFADAEEQSLKIWRRYRLKFGFVLTIHLFSVQLMKYFVITSIELCMNTSGLFFTPCANVLWPFPLHPKAR